MAQKLFGTNCGNCKFFKGKVDKPLKLNAQGGVKSENRIALARAKKADLVTLPGNQQPTASRGCSHKEVAQPVNDRMCCAFWDNDGALREFK